MSAYITLATPMLDKESLVKALIDMGFEESQIEKHDTPVVLVGFEGADRSRHANVVIRREHIGQVSNDVGFERTSTGFRAHISDFDQARFDSTWFKRLNARYNHHDQLKKERLAREAAQAAEIEARRLAELELKRIEEERKRLVESQRQSIREKAKKLGYGVKETRQGDKIRMVLVKRIY